MSRINRKGLVPCVMSALIMATVFSGCGSELNYTDEQENIIADYAAALLLRHDVNHKDDYIIPKEKETTFEETTELAEETSIDPQNQDMPIEGESTSPEESGQLELADTTKITNAFGVGGITVEYVGYSVSDMYPNENQEDALFVMRAVEGTKLLVVKFRFTNNTGADVPLNMMESSRKYRAYVNENERYSPQITLLLDGLNTYDDVFKAGNSEELVLVYQTKIEKDEDVNSLVLSVSDNGGNISEIRLK